MKKITYYLTAIVIFGIAITSFWLWNKYFRTKSEDVITASVARKDIQEMVHERGDVVSQKEFDLEFPFSGNLEKIFVSEGQTVKKGDPLMRLETTDLSLEKDRLNSVLLQSKATLQKLQAGVTLEDMTISTSQVENAKVALDNAKNGLTDAIIDAQIKADDAIRNKIDPLFLNPRSDPKLSFQPTDNQLKTDIEAARLLMERKFSDWSSLITSLSTSSDLRAISEISKDNLLLAQTISSKAALILSNLAPSGSLTQTTIDAWRVNISAGRTAMGLSMTNLTAAQEKLEVARSNLIIAENQLALKQAGTRSEEITIAQAQIAEINDEIATVNERITRATLRAPADAKVTKIWVEKNELAGPGKVAVSLSIPELKIQSDISELDIGRIREEDAGAVSIEFDAFPGVKYSGKVFSIDSKEIVEEGDKYFRVNIVFDAGTDTTRQIRAGMSADLVIYGITKKNVLAIPEIAVYKSGNKRYVKILENGAIREVEIETGISDDDVIEVIRGLSEGQTVLVSGS